MLLSSLFGHDWAESVVPLWGNIHSNSNPHKIAFEILGIPVAWYAIMILMAVILSVVVGYFGFAKRLGATTDYLFEGVIVGVVSGVVGGRLWYVVANILEEGSGSSFIQPTIIGSIIEMVNIRDGGLAISGAVILVGISLFIFCKYRHIKLLYVLEIVMPLIMLSQVLGRWGNFFNFEAHGGFINVPGLQEGLENTEIISSIKTLPKDVLDAQRNFLWFFPNFMKDRMFIDVGGVWGYCHPCFFYEGVANFIGTATYMIVRRFVKKGMYVGDGISFYLIWYGVVRFFIESLRTDAQMIGDTGIKVVMVYTPIMVILGITWLIVRRVLKIQMVPTYEALYGKDSSMLVDPSTIKPKKKKIKKNNKDVSNA